MRRSGLMCGMGRSTSPSLPPPLSRMLILSLLSDADADAVTGPGRNGRGPLTWSAVPAHCPDRTNRVRVRRPRRRTVNRDRVRQPYPGIVPGLRTLRKLGHRSMLRQPCSITALPTGAEDLMAPVVLACDPSVNRRKSQVCASCALVRSMAFIGSTLEKDQFILPDAYDAHSRHYPCFI